MFDKPLGGTELMYNELMKRLPDAYGDIFSIFNYVSQADFSKKTIFWNQLSHDQEAVQWLKEKNNQDLIEQFVFVSNWQSENYRKVFGIPAYKTKVLQNAYAQLSTAEKDSQKIKICYTSTPWRGLDVLLRAWEILNLQGCELHVFSSTKIYGQEFSATQESIYEPLYQKCQELKNVFYRGSVPNNVLLDELGSFHIMAYPSTFEETSCISVIEAISNGLRVVCSNLGALPETTQGWARIYTYPENKEVHAIRFAEVLQNEIEMLRRGYFHQSSKNQKNIYSPLWAWDYRIYEWRQFLSGIILKEKNMIVRNSWDRSIFQECYVENEYHVTEFKDTDVIIDLGCHIGSFSLLAYERGSRNIYSFEALKANYEIAKNNLKDTNVNLKNLAVWRSDVDVEKAKFNANIVDWNTGMGRIEENSTDTENTVEVNCIKFDTILSWFEQVNFLKIDIEGSEYSVLYTSCQLDKIQHICGEYHNLEDNQINGYTFDGVGLKRFLTDNGFDVVMQEATWSNFCGFFKATKIK